MSSSIFYPYKYAGQALEISEIDIDIDGEACAGNNFVDQEHRSIVLTSFEKKWEELKIRVKITDPNLQLDAVLPSAVNKKIVKVWLVARNKSTRLRSSVLLQSSADGWVGELKLRREDYARTTELECFATLSTDIELIDGFANKSNERIADAESWKLYVDILPAMPGGALNSEWVNFDKSQNSELSKRNDCVWFLDLSDSESPRLLLNEAVPKLRQTLEVESKTSKPARVRDALIHSILQGVINELAIFALADADGSTLDELGEWQKKLLSGLARRDDSGSEAIVAERWIRSWKSSTDVGRILTEITTSVQRHLNVRHSSEYLARSVETESNND